MLTPTSSPAIQQRIQLLARLAILIFQGSSRMVPVGSCHMLCCEIAISESPTRTQRESNKSRRIGKMLATFTNPFGPSA